MEEVKCPDCLESFYRFDSFVNHCVKKHHKKWYKEQASHKVA